MDDADLIRLRDEVAAAPDEGEVLNFSRYAVTALLDHIADLTVRAETAEAKVQLVEAVHARYFDLDGKPGQDDTTPESEDVWRYDRDLRAALAAPAQTEPVCAGGSCGERAYCNEAGDCLAAAPAQTEHEYLPLRADDPTGFARCSCGARFAPHGGSGGSGAEWHVAHVAAQTERGDRG